MATLGWLPGGQAKWKGRNYKWYYKGARPESINAKATALEAARKAALIDGDFND